MALFRESGDVIDLRGRQDTAGQAGIATLVQSSFEK